MCQLLTYVLILDIQSNAPYHTVKINPNIYNLNKQSLGAGNIYFIRFESFIFD